LDAAGSQATVAAATSATALGSATSEGEDQADAEAKELIEDFLAADLAAMVAALPYDKLTQLTRLRRSSPTL